VNEISSDLYLNIQDCMISRMLLEILEGLDELECEESISKSIDFLSWLLNYRESSTLIKLWIMHGISVKSMDLLCRSEYIASTLGTAIESIFNPANTALFSIVEYKCLLEVSLQYLRRCHDKFICITISALIPMFLSRLFSSLSIYHDLKDINDIVMRMVEFLGQYFPGLLSKIIAISDRLGDEERSLLKPAAVKAADLYKSYREVIIINRAAGSLQGAMSPVATMLPPPL
jgi:hypothetical protein